MTEDADPSQQRTPQPASSGSRPKVWQPPTAVELQAMLPDYEITLLLGRGGMGAVYKGVQRNLDRPVAIKILPPDLADAEGNYADRFRNEARAMARMNHYGIVKVYDFGEVKGLLYFVMEFIEGTDVSRMIARKGRLPADHALAITAHVCDALHYAHERGIIHRDIKPANIMVGQDGVVKVADFGLAKMAEGGHSGLTRSGMAMGTLHYMAPEALTLGTAVDHRADIYAVGVMFYHMLAGRLPQGVFEPLHRQFPELDPRYDDIVARAMRDDRELRYPSAAALRADLDSLLTRPVMQVVAEEKTPATPPTTGHSQQQVQEPEHDPSEDHWQHSPPPAPRSGRHWLPWAALLIIGGVIAWLLMDHTPRETELAQAESAKPLLPPYTNSLGMKFVSVPGTDVQFCVHETRRKDYAAYAAAVPGVDATWKTANSDGVPCGDQDNHPVVAVNWEDARAFCAWLSKKEGRVFRLPTDAEWSLAVGLPQEDGTADPEKRAAQNRGIYPWGKDWPPPPKSGNFADTSTIGQLPRIKEHIAGYNDGFMTTCSVMTFPANLFGLHDMEGNVSEWTSDWLNPKQERFAVRGGSWALSESNQLLSARRFGTAASLRYPHYGFRVVVEPTSKTLQPLAETTPKKPATPPTAAFTNSLGMKFVPVPGTQTLFCIHETRRQDYEAYAKDNPGVDSGWKGTFGLKPEELPMLPVHSRSWHDAKAFCAWLSRKEGITYRLPTDREWSFAVGIAQKEDPKATPGSLRQKLKTHFPWGTEWPPPKDAGNYGHVGTKADFERELPYLTPDPHPTIAPVMSYHPNSLGIYDLGGNVGEWCEDGWDETKTERVLRGGMWTSYSPGYRLSSERMRHKPETRFLYWGFRVVAEAAAPFPAAPSVVEKNALPAPVTNSLGMRFVPVPCTDILMCVHETRRRDYSPYQTAVAGVDSAWKSTDIYGVAFKEDENLPVMRVSWEDAMLYADWLGRQEGRLYRLPTDREWSHAVGIAADEAPFMTTSELNNKIAGVYPWGTIWPPPAGAGNYADESARALVQNPKLDMKGVIEGFNDGFATLAPVMSLKPNTLGLYDLGGNVQEWCMDWHDEKAGRRVMRGSCYSRHEETRLLSSRRDHTAYDGRGFNIGFRLVLVPGAKPQATEPLKLPPQTAFTNTLGMRFVPVPGTDICMCVHETRRGDYAKFAAENLSADTSWRGTIAGTPENRGDDFAVGAMSWNDATAFCQWLTKKEGRAYRLPTDREWSCAVGIGQDEPPGFSGSVLKNRLPGVYPWGKEWPPKSPVENFADTASKAKFPPGNSIGLNAFMEGYTDGFPTTARVMSFPPNALGIYDLGGNVREWCADHGNSAITGYVMRGGCWKSCDSTDTYSSFRMIREPDKRSSEYGFRIVAEPLPAVPAQKAVP